MQKDRFDPTVKNIVLIGSIFALIAGIFLYFLFRSELGKHCLIGLGLFFLIGLIVYWMMSSEKK